MGWCVECYSEQRQIQATKELDGDPLCERHYLLAMANGGKSMDDKVCGREGCGKALTSANKSGYCTAHFYDSKKKNGKPAPRATARHKPESITVSVPVSLLDELWGRLSAKEKAERLFQ